MSSCAHLDQAVKRRRRFANGSYAVGYWCLTCRRWVSRDKGFAGVWIGNSAADASIPELAEHEDGPSPEQGRLEL